MVEEQKIREKKKSCYLSGVLHSVHESHRKTSIQQRSKILFAFLLFFTVFMDLRAKHSSNREIQQRKVVTYGRRIKNRRKEEKLLPFWCS